MTLLKVDLSILSIIVLNLCSKFSSGIKGLSQKIREIEYSSAMMITQLGTWHSHPNSSSTPSSIDLSSKKQMYKDRNNMPTVCLIWSQDGFTLY